MKPFQPSADLVKGIIDTLNKQTSLKNEIWNLLMLLIERAHAIKVRSYINEQFEEDGKAKGVGESSYITYEVLINAIIKSQENMELSKSLAGK